MYIETYNNISELPKSISKLFMQYERHSLFLGQSWFKLYEDFFLNTQKNIFIVVWSEEHQVILLFLLQKGGTGNTLHAVSNYYSALYSPLSIAKVDDSEILKAYSLIIKKIFFLNNIQHIELKPIALNSRENKLLIQSLKKHHFIIESDLYTGNWFYKVKTATFEQYLSQRPSQLKNTLKRKTKQLEKTQSFHMKIYSTEEDIKAHIGEYEKIYQSSWKVTEGSAEFIHQLILEYAKTGHTRLGVAYIDGEAAASQFWLIHNQKALIYKLAYAPKYKNYSIGSLLTAHMIKKAIEDEKVDIIDYLTGDDSYKKDWMNCRVELSYMMIYNIRTLNGAYLGLKYLLKTAIKNYLFPLLPVQKKSLLKIAKFVPHLKTIKK